MNGFVLCGGINNNKKETALELSSSLMQAGGLEQESSSQNMRQRECRI